MLTVAESEQYEVLKKTLLDWLLSEKVKWALIDARVLSMEGDRQSQAACLNSLIARAVNDEPAGILWLANSIRARLNKIKDCPLSSEQLGTLVRLYDQR